MNDKQRVQQERITELSRIIAAAAGNIRWIKESEQDLNIYAALNGVHRQLVDAIDIIDSFSEWRNEPFARRWPGIKDAITTGYAKDETTKGDTWDRVIDIVGRLANVGITPEQAIMLINTVLGSGGQL